MKETESQTVYRYCGRDFTRDEVEQICSLIADHPEYHRVELSRQICDRLDWVRLDGGSKEMSCRVALLRMERDGLLTLPPPRKGNGNGRTHPRLTPASEPREPVDLPAGALGELQFQLVETPADSRLWNELIERYHYLGYKPLPGAQLRYQVFSDSQSRRDSVCQDGTGQPHLLAVLGFGAAAWKVAPRDRFIGWTPEQRERNLHLVINNARFLILPWITSRNLASRLLSRLTRQLPEDWERRYRYRPVLLETFVERDRFFGACYRAANWIHVGQTQGRGKLDRKKQYALPVKEVFLYPLHKHFRDKLCV